MDNRVIKELERIIRECKDPKTKRELEWLLDQIKHM